MGAGDTGARLAAPTVVSLQWDDGTADEYQVLPMLQSYGMTGTFFINSGRISTDGYMSLSQIQSLAAAGNVNTVTFNATMVQNGPAITITLGNLVSGALASKPLTGGTLTWTPSTNSTDLAGNKNTTAPASTAGPAF